MGEKKPEKENGFLKNLIDIDKKISGALSLSASQTSPLGQYRSHMKALEYSCHGVFWFPAAMVCIWFTDDPGREAYFFNLLLALVLDVLFLAVMKAAIGRERPPNNQEDMFMTYSVDKMSCPSGHTTRAVLLTYIFIASTPEMYLLHLILLIWCFCTSASRVLLGRHYLGDVLIGVFLGYFEYCIMDYVWAGPATAKWYLDFFKDTSIIDDL